MSRLRARIAERLLQSQASNAILTTFNEVNMAPVMALRKQYGEKFEKLTVFVWASWDFSLKRLVLHHRNSQS